MQHFCDTADKKLKPEFYDKETPISNKDCLQNNHNLQKKKSEINKRMWY